MEPELEEVQYSPYTQDFKEVVIGVSKAKANEPEEVDTVDIDDGFRYPSDRLMSIFGRLEEFDNSSAYSFFSHIPTLEFAKWMGRFIPQSTLYKQDWL